MMNSQRRANQGWVYAYASDSYAAYALIIPAGERKKVWRARFMQPKLDHLGTKDFPESKFKNIESFIGYIKLKYIV